MTAMDSPTTSDWPDLLPSSTPSEREEILRLLHRYQLPLWQPQKGPQTAAFLSQADIIGYGGSAGGGKSDLLLGLAIREQQRTLILRREASQNSALIDRSRELLAGNGRFNGTPGREVWRLSDGRQIEFGGVADPGEEQKYRGRPHDFLAVDEADQIAEHVVRFLMAWVRTTNPDQKCRVAICFNPPACAEGRWLLSFFGPWIDPRHPHPAVPGELRWYATLRNGKEVERPNGERFADGGETITPKSRTFIPARVTDNAYLMATDYVSQLQALPEPLRSQLLYGDMAAGLEDDPWQVIPTSWVQAAQARWQPGPPDGFTMSCLGADIARGGKDKTVISARYEMWFSPLVRHPGASTPDGPMAAARILAFHDGQAEVNIDVIGIGSSAYDCVKAHIGPLAHPINNSESSTLRDRSGRYGFVNVRAASYWSLREALDPDHGVAVALPPDAELLADLTAPRYSVQANGIKVEPKDDIIERIGRSPDAGDAVVLAWWTPKKKKFWVM